MLEQSCAFGSQDGETYPQAHQASRRPPHYNRWQASGTLGAVLSLSQRDNGQSESSPLHRPGLASTVYRRQSTATTTPDHPMIADNTPCHSHSMVPGGFDV